MSSLTSSPSPKSPPTSARDFANSSTPSPSPPATTSWSSPKAASSPSPPLTPTRRRPDKRRLRRRTAHDLPELFVRPKAEDLSPELARRHANRLALSLGIESRKHRGRIVRQFSYRLFLIFGGIRTRHALRDHLLK